MTNKYCQFWNDLKIGLRLTIVISIILALTLIVGLVGWLTLESQAHSQNIENQATDLVGILHSARQNEKNYMLRGKVSDIKETIDAIERIRQNAKILKSLLPEDKQVNITKLLIEQDNYKKEFEGYVKLNYKKEQNLQEMVSHGRNLENTAISLRDDQKKELQHLESLAVSSSDERLEKSEKADDANRMIKLMSEARQQEKNFLLRHEKRYLDTTINLVEKLIIQASSTKERFEDTQNQLLAQQIIDIADEYIEELQRVFLGKLEENKVDKKMILLGREVEERSTKLREDQKQELIKLENGQSKDISLRLDKRQKADGANRIIKFMSEARQQEKNFLLRKEQSYVEVTLSLSNSVIAEATILRSKFLDEENKLLALKIIDAAKQYIIEFKRVVEITKKNIQAQDIMASLGRKVEDKASQLRDDQKQELNKLEKSSALSSKQRLDKRLKADETNRIIQLMSEARQEEKNFLLRHEKAYSELTITLVMQAVRQAQLLRNRFVDEQNRVLIDKINLAAKRYLKEFEGVILAENEQYMQQERMINAARKIEKLAKIVRKQTQLKASQTKQTAINIILITILLSLIIGIIMALFLTETISKPIRQLIGVINGLAREDNIKVPLVINKDEIGQIARAISNFKEVLLKRKVKIDMKLIQAEKMVALGDLVAGVAHEINTPIGIAVTGSTHLQDQILSLEKAFEAGSLRKSDFRAFVENALPTANSIQTNLERAAILVKSFKQVAIDQSSQEIRKFLLFGYIKEIITSLQPKLKQVKHKIFLSGDEKLVVETIPGAISQIVTNLILNSFNHAYNKSNKIGKINIYIGIKDNMATITYTDDGKGMDEQTIKRIYEPFFTTARSKGGSGLGLSIIYNLATKTLKGTIDCESKLDNGTTFHISFPIKNTNKGLNNE